MLLWRSIREYVAVVVRAYTPFVLGLVFGVAGAIGLFVSDQSGVRVAALIGVALGFLVGPYKAFQQMRPERDAARANDQFAHLRTWQYVNRLSGGSWSIEGFQSPNVPGLVVRAIVAADHALRAEAEVDSDGIERLRDAAAASRLDRWLNASFVDGAGSVPLWQLASPCNGFEITVERSGVRVGGGGSEISARVMLSLPRGMYGVAPRLMIDVISRDVPKDPDISLDEKSRPFELAGEPWRPDLEQMFDLLNELADTLVGELAADALDPIVHRSRREHLVARLRHQGELRLIGPNFDVLAKPRPLVRALQLPDFQQLPGGYSDAEIMAETPTRVSPTDREQRGQLIRRAFKTSLRRQQFLHFEDYVDGIGGR